MPEKRGSLWRFTELLQEDFGALPFQDGTFDLVVSRNVTHIIREHLKVYGEWLRVLKPGGVLLIFDANWHLPYQPGPVREEAIRREREGLKNMAADTPTMAPMSILTANWNRKIIEYSEKPSVRILTWAY